jgi:divalent metal cation (Fe/Co/Zn/Cd) transporter
MAVHAADLRSRALRLEYLTIAWMIVEATVAIASGVAAGSVALTGFGLDSVIELAAAGVVLWQFSGVEEHRQHTAHRVIAVSLYALGAYITFDSIYTLVRHERPEHSLPGILVAVAALAIMPTLARAKRRIGRAMGNAAVIADSSESAVCAYMSAIVLVGLVANAALSWWWADPVAAFGIAAFAVHEGREAWKGEGCC